MALEYRIIPVTAYQQNCTLVRCSETNKLAAIDPGGDIERVLRSAEEWGGDWDKILLTHGHMDHVGGAKPLRSATGVPVLGPNQQDEFWIEQIAMQASMLGMPAVETFTPDQWFKGGETVALGNLAFEVIHCPGHTPGHVIYFCREASWAQVGDVIFSGSIGRTDFPRSDHSALLDSIRNNLFPLGDEIAFVPGHGPMSTFGQERQTNPFGCGRTLSLTSANSA